MGKHTTKSQRQRQRITALETRIYTLKQENLKLKTMTELLLAVSSPIKDQNDDN